MRSVVSVCICILLGLVYPSLVSAAQPVSAAETRDTQVFVSGESGLEVMFVIDCSGSMRANDPSRTAIGMVMAFIDSVHAQEMQIGYVAYNDAIVSSAAPVSIDSPEEREALKERIGAVSYSGDTDTGLAFTYARQLMTGTERPGRVMVLITDGETDVKPKEGRTTGLSKTETQVCARACAWEGIPVYTVAFGEYDGSREELTQVSGLTGGESYEARTPENLIDVLYGILEKNTSYKIQQLSSGIYARGVQEIKCVPDEPYLDEMDVLLISEGKIGETFIEYGDSRIAMTDYFNYAVGKIDAGQIDPAVRSFTVSVATEERQNLRTYLVSYRKLFPVLETRDAVAKHTENRWQISFKDRSGAAIEDEAFYKAFAFELTCVQGNAEAFRIQEPFAAGKSGITGSVCLEESGTYTLSGVLSDPMGEYRFTVPVTAANTPPAGTLPGVRCTVLDGEIRYSLGAHITDADGDAVSFSLAKEEPEAAVVQLSEEVLLIRPKRAGTQVLMITAGDGEDETACPLQIEVIPLWRAYWWLCALSLICFTAAAVLIARWRRRHKPELERLTEETKKNLFCGRLDAYFTAQPEGEEEIPPLTFQMHKVKDNRVSLGDLLKDYPGASEALELDVIYLAADEDRRMLLYHTSKAAVMVGNAIACRRIRYSVCFGDVIYITAQDGTYDLEIHYIAMIQ